MRPARAHENATAYLIAARSGGERWIRSALFRAVCLAAYAAAAALSGESLWALLAVVMPALGVYCALADALYVVRGTRFRDPLARLAIRNSERTFGERVPNVSGLLEGFGLLSLFAGLYAFNGDALWVLLAQAAAAAFLGSIAANILLDPSYYNPGLNLDGAAQRSLDLLRLLGGPVCALLTAGVATWAVAPDLRAISLAISASLLAVDLRIREVDRVAAAAHDAALDRELLGRKEVAQVLHGMVGAPLHAVKGLSKPLRHEHLDLYDAVRQMDAGFRETLTLDQGLDVHIEWPGILIGRLRAIQAQYGCHRVTLDTGEERISMDDRQLARLIIDDLADNAGKAGAREIAVILSRSGTRWTVSVTDDAPAIPPLSWLRPGGSLERWQYVLATRGGGLERSGDGTPKTISASWVSQADHVGDPDFQEDLS